MTATHDLRGGEAPADPSERYTRTMPAPLTTQDDLAFSITVYPDDGGQKAVERFSAWRPIGWVAAVLAVVALALLAR
jgi:hypothetical protein